MIPEYKEVTQTPNPYENLYALREPTNKVRSLDDNVKSVLNSVKIKQMVQAWRDQGKTIKYEDLPGVMMIAPINQEMLQDIQRDVDAPHCARIGNPDTFNAKLTNLSVGILNSRGKFQSGNNQHTETLLGALAYFGLILKDGKPMPYDEYMNTPKPHLGFETDSVVHLRKQFGISNGKKSLPQSKMQELKNSVYTVRIDKDTSYPEDVEWERKLSIAESYGVYPREAAATGYANSFSHLVDFLSMDDEAIKMACKWQSRYFHYTSVSSFVWFMFKQAVSQFKKSKLSITDEMLSDIAGIIQGYFGEPETFFQALKRAHADYTENFYGEKTTWDPSCQAPIIFQLYQRLGGKDKIPAPFAKSYNGLTNADPCLVDFFDKALVDKYV